jgi:hypothetical protein
MKPMFLIVLAWAFTSATSQAAVITIPPGGGTRTTFHRYRIEPTGAESQPVNGFTISGNLRDGDAPYGLISNGSWDDFAWVGTFGTGTPFQIDLGGLFSTAGGLFNYGPGNDPQLLTGLLRFQRP